MKVDDVLVEVGLKFWDSYHGYGEVIAIGNETFEVAYKKNGRTLTYANDGKMAGVKTLFSAPPFVVAPTKDQKAMLIRVLDALRINHSLK